MSKEAFEAREAMCKACSSMDTCEAAFVADVPCPDEEEFDEPE